MITVGSRCPWETEQAFAWLRSGVLLYFCCSTVCIYSTLILFCRGAPRMFRWGVISVEALYRVEWFCISMTDDPHDAFFFWGGGVNVFYYSDNHHHHQSQQELFVTFGNYKRCRGFCGVSLRPSVLSDYCELSFSLEYPCGERECFRTVFHVR